LLCGNEVKVKEEQGLQFRGEAASEVEAQSKRVSEKSPDPSLHNSKSRVPSLLNPQLLVPFLKVTPPGSSCLPTGERRSSGDMALTRAE
jgi:hypothetical protein